MVDYLAGFGVNYEHLLQVHEAYVGVIIAEEYALDFEGFLEIYSLGCHLVRVVDVNLIHELGLDFARLLFKQFFAWPVIDELRPL